MNIPVQKLLLSDPFHDASFVTMEEKSDKMIRSVNIIDNPYGFQFVEKDSLLIIGGQDWYLKEHAQEDIFCCLKKNQVACIVLYNFEETIPFYNAIQTMATEAGIPILLMGENARILPYGKILEYFSEHYYIAAKDQFLQKGFIQQQMYRCAEQDKINCIAKRLWIYTDKEVFAQIDDKSYHYGRKTDIDVIMSDRDKWVSTTGHKAEKLVNGGCYYYGPQEVFFSIYSFDRGMDTDYIMLISKDQQLGEQELQIFQYAFWAIQADFKRNSMEFAKQQTEKLKRLLDQADSAGKDGNVTLEGFWGNQLSQVLVMNNILNQEDYQTVHEEIYRKIQKNSQAGGELLFGEYEDNLVMLIPASFMSKVKEDRFRKLLKKNSVQGKMLRIGYGDEVYRPDLRACYLQAKKALFWANLQKDKQLISYADLGFLALLEEKDILDKVHGYNNRYLEKLLAYDQKNNTELFHTLSIYITCLWNFSSASKLLFVHLNTVKYRIEQAEKILELDFSDSDVRLNLEVAVKIREFLGE